MSTAKWITEKNTVVRIHPNRIDRPTRDAIKSRITIQYAPPVVLPPIFCRSCEQSTVAEKGRYCPTCVVKAVNNAKPFFPLPYSPTLAILTMIVAAFGIYALVSWLFQ